jgi:phospho-N-acetylmuramoyl-pentapeptide-transferase
MLPLFRITEVDLPLLFCSLYALLNGAVGIIDDLTKFAHRKNEGLSVFQKFSLQLLLAILYLFALSKTGSLSTDLSFGFGIPDLSPGIFFYPLALILLVGTVNSLNLTDGLDGLAGSVSSVIFAFFLLIASALSHTSLFFSATCLLGITLAFLCFNRHPAKIFMGDTGSLFFGATICGLAFYLNAPLLLLPIAIFPLWEALSVMLQVGYYKLTHRRLFLMAPFHHHLERRGYSENKIVFFATFVTLLGCILAYFWVRYGGIV